MAIVRRNRKEQVNLNTQSRLKAVRVIDIILDINHPLAEKYGSYDSTGTIFYVDIDGNTPNILPSNASVAVPLFSHVKYYPLKNEIVLILTTNDKNIYEAKLKTTYYLPQVNMWGHPHHNALPTTKMYNKDPNNVQADYEQTLAGIVRRPEDGATDIELGNYFKEKLNIKPLLPYEGDYLIEGRFGNSIRFGSTNADQSISDPNNWSDSGETGDPITIIRNGQSSNLDEKGWLPTSENINEDHSSIYLTSNQRISAFRQASPYMESYNAEYIRPQSIEQQLLDPQITELAENTTDSIISEELGNISTINPNEEVNMGSLTDATNEVPDENPEIDLLPENPEIDNEAESGTDLSNQLVQKDSDIILPDSYVDPGDNGEGGPGIEREVDIAEGNPSFDPSSAEVNDQTNIDLFTP